MSRTEADEAVSVISFISSSLVYVNGILFGKFGSLLDRTSSIYVNVTLHALVSVIL